MFAGENAHAGAADLIAGFEPMISRAHQRVINIHGATLPPAGGGSEYFNSVFDQKRQRANAFTRSGAFDGFHLQPKTAMRRS